MTPSVAQDQVLTSRARVRVCQWGCQMGKTALLKMILNREERTHSPYPRPILVDDAETLTDEQVDLLWQLADCGTKLVVVGTPDSDDTPYLILARRADADFFQATSGRNLYSFLAGFVEKGAS